VGLLLWIGIPVLLGAILSLLAGGREGPKPQAYVLVADRDDSFVSGFLVGALSQDRAGGVLRAERVAEDDGRRRVAKGEATALLVIPEGFGRAVLREEPTTLRLLTNPAQRILPGIVEESLGALADGVFYLHRLIGPDLRAMAEGPPDTSWTMPDAWVSDVSVRVNRVAGELRGTLFPPVIALDTADAGAEADGAADDAGTTDGDAAGQATGFALLFVPGLLFMSLLFMAQGIAEDLWEERESRTLRRAIVAPASPGALLGGKLLAGAGVMALVSAVALAVAWGWFRLGWARYPVAVLWSAVSGTVLLVLFAALQLHLPTRRGASVLSSALVFPLMMLGGSFFPFEAMPGWMVAVGRWTPNGWALERLKDVLLDRASLDALLRSGAALGALGAVLFTVASRRLGASFSRS